MDGISVVFVLLGIGAIWLFMLGALALVAVIVAVLAMDGELKKIFNMLEAQRQKVEKKRLERQHQLKKVSALFWDSGNGIGKKHDG